MSEPRGSKLRRERAPSTMGRGLGGLHGSGSGLAGMVDRVAAQGGSLALESSAGAGTRIAMELPCVS